MNHPHAELDHEGGARLSDDEIDELDALLAEVPDPFDSMDAAMVDGFLAGIASLPQPVATREWLPHVFHTEPDPDAVPRREGGVKRVAELTERRLSFIRASIAAREPFDPILLEVPPRDEDGRPNPPTLPLAPWAAGFANAMGAFPSLMQLTDEELPSLLVGIYRHLPAEEKNQSLRDLQREANEVAPLGTLDDALVDVMGCLLSMADIVQPRRPQLREAPKVGRNDPCSCGSGRKFKQCHGKS